MNQLFDGGFRHGRRRRPVWFVMDCYGLSIQVSDELRSFFLRSKFSLVETCLNVSSNGVRIIEFRHIGRRTACWRGRKERSLGLAPGDRFDLSCRSGPTACSIPLKPASKRLHPARSKHCQPDVDNPRPSAWVSPMDSQNSLTHLKRRCQFAVGQFHF